MKKLKKAIPFIIIGILAAAVISLSVILIVIKNQPDKRSYYETKVDSFGVQNANLSKGQIIFIGDSITDLYPLDNYYTDLPLATYNRGIGGDVTTGVYKRLNVSLYDLKPSKVVLMIGINDIDGGRSLSSITADYRKILNSIKTNLPETEVYVMSVISQHEKLMDYTMININRTIPKVIELNANIKSLAEEFNYTYLDLFTLTADENNKLIKEYSDDGIHLNAAGFSVWTELLKPYLKG